ncbi:hypothetical protein ACFVUS_27960 [Nocardia sp. NPDC058058]|uniref:hypothetical protein n=1 Tax=Nocardia sp. NPDC058058 TaxID=3346317 RepID=UPI0036DA3EB7
MRYRRLSVAIAIFASTLEMRLEEMLEQQNSLATRIPDADSTDLPSVLIEPLWTQPRRRPRPVVIADMAVERPIEIHWAPGEQEAWAQVVLWTWGGDADAWYTFTKWEGTTIDDPTWPARIAQMVAQRSPGLGNVLAVAPEELVRPHLSTARPGYMSSAEPARRILGLYGLAATDFVIAVAAQNPGFFAYVLAPLEGTSITALMLDWVNYKRSRESALAWFRRHPGAAALDLVPLALSAPGKQRRRAETLLRLLSEDGYGKEIDTAAATFGEVAAAAISAALSDDPLLRLPARIPALPKWLNLAVLPQIRLRHIDRALPLAAVADFVTMLAMSSPGNVYPDVRVVTEAIDRTSGAQFGWALFELWESAGHPAKHAWIFHALGLLGDDTVAEQLRPMIQAWPTAGASTRAADGLAVLAMIGSDVALDQLRIIAGESKSGPLRRRATAKLRAPQADH